MLKKKEKKKQFTYLWIFVLDSCDGWSVERVAAIFRLVAVPPQIRRTPRMSEIENCFVCRIVGHIVTFPQLEF